MSKAAIATDRAPAAIGPYSQAVRAGDFVFTSGQIALDPRTGELVPGGIEAETRQVLDNLSAVLEAAGAGWRDVVRTTIYLADLGDFALVNKLYGERVGGRRAARALHGAGRPAAARRRRRDRRRRARARQRPPLVRGAGLSHRPRGAAPPKGPGGLRASPGVHRPRGPFVPRGTREHST